MDAVVARLAEPSPLARPFARCLAGIAGVVHHLGRSDFPDRIVEAIRCFVESDTALVMRYARTRTPLVLHDDYDHALRRNNLDAYVDGAYLIDPFYAKATEEDVEGVFRLRDIVAPDFRVSEYFRQHYKDSRVSDEVNFLIRLGNDTTLAISLERIATKPPFSDEEMVVLESLYPLVAELARADWAMRPCAGDGDDSAYLRHESLRERLASFGADRLTPREREVLHLLLSGYDNREAGDALGLSCGTVRVHRRNIYQKLEITSIAGLFAVVLESILDAA